MDVKELRALIREANRDIDERVKNSVLQFGFDSDSDTLYFSLQDYKPEKVIISVESAPVDDTVYMRVEDETWKVIGFDILSWQEAYLSRNPEFSSAFAPILNAVGYGDFSMEVEPTTRGEPGALRLYVPQQLEEWLADAA